MTQAHFSISVLVLMLVCTASYSQVYAWKDEKGRVHYGDAPPPKKVGMQVDAITIKEKNPAGKLDETVERRKARQADLLRDYEESARKKAEEKAKQKEDRRKKEQRCKRAKSRVKHNKRYSLIFYEREDGERTYLDDAQRKKYDKELQEKVAKHCS